MAIKDPSLEKRVNCSYQPMNSDGSFFPSCPETNQFPSCGQIKYVIHVVYVATRSLFPQFVIYIIVYQYDQRVLRDLHLYLHVYIYIYLTAVLFGLFQYFEPYFVHVFAR